VQEFSFGKPLAVFRILKFDALQRSARLGDQAIPPELHAELASRTEGEDLVYVVSASTAGEVSYRLRRPSLEPRTVVTLGPQGDRQLALSLPFYASVCISAEGDVLYAVASRLMRLSRGALKAEVAREGVTAIACDRDTSWEFTSGLMTKRRLGHGTIQARRPVQGVVRAGGAGRLGDRLGWYSLSANEKAVSEFWLFDFENGRAERIGENWPSLVVLGSRQLLGRETTR
jgi:hypothetical protein